MVAKPKQSESRPLMMKNPSAASSDVIVNDVARVFTSYVRVISLSLSLYASLDCWLLFPYPVSFSILNNTDTEDVASAYRHVYGFCICFVHSLAVRLLRNRQLKPDFHGSLYQGQNQLLPSFCILSTSKSIIIGKTLK